MNAISTFEQLAVCPAHHEQLRSALDHIARTCVSSRTQTRRIRWIEARATGALRGEPFLQEAISLPKDGGPKTAEKLQGLVLDLKRDLRRSIVSHGLTLGILMCERQALINRPPLNPNLFAIYIPGPDEYHAAPSLAAALHMADKHNAAMAEWYAAHPDPEGHGPSIECTLASVVTWPFNAEDHAEDLATFNAAEWGWTEPKGAA